MQPAIGVLIFAISASLAGCYGVYGGYSDEPEWDGSVYLGGGYGPGGYDRDHRWHGNAFRGDGRRSADAVSGRGHASLGPSGGGRIGGGSSGEGGHAGGGGHR